MHNILILQQHSNNGFFKIKKAECSDEEYKRYTDLCDKYYFKLVIKSYYEDLHFGFTSTDTETKEAAIPHENILIKDGEVTGFLYNTSQTPNGFDTHNGQNLFLLDDEGGVKHVDGQIVFLLDDEGVVKLVGGFASVGCRSGSEYCTLTRK